MATPADGAPLPPITAAPLTGLGVPGNSATATGDAAPQNGSVTLLNQVAGLAPLTGALPSQPTEAAKPSGGAMAPASPPDQVAMAVVSVATSAANNPQVTLHLHPADLGLVQIRIERSGPGLARIEVIAEKPDTLAMLQSSQAQLHQSLDLAGMPAAGRTLTFHIAAPAPESQAASTTAAPNTPLGTGFSGSGQPNGQAGSGNRSPYQSQPDGMQGGVPLARGDAVPAGAAAARSYRIGLDITA
ncbi:MAG TPA: flagellar hook-length control protein FliK [Rhodopila sp.]|nr:flagellar hook-length control protein FliK [Rhodopila sp.]